MTDKPLANRAASIKARLLNLARQSQSDFLLVLGRYAAERFLYRLSISSVADRFVLKGAALFRIWSDTEYRPTRDIDFLGFGPSDPESIRVLVETVCAVPCQEDGLAFDTANIAVNGIRDDLTYGGQRVKLTAYLEKTRIPVQLDIGFGDAITPEAIEADYPTLLGHPAPRLRTYPRETVVAEKFEAMVKLGPANSRMKDFWDLAVLSEGFTFSFDTLASAVRATFDRRGTPLGAGV